MFGTSAHKLATVNSYWMIVYLDFSPPMVHGIGGEQMYLLVEEMCYPPEGYPGCFTSG